MNTVNKRLTREGSESSAEITNLEKKLHYHETTLKNSRENFDQILKSGGRAWDIRGDITWFYKWIPEVILDGCDLVGIWSPREQALGFLGSAIYLLQHLPCRYKCARWWYWMLENVALMRLDLWKKVRVPVPCFDGHVCVWSMGTTCSITGLRYPGVFLHQWWSSMSPWIKAVIFVGAYWSP